MAENTLTTIDGALKQLIRAKNFGTTTYKRRPMFALLSKFEGFGGRNMPIPVVYANGAGGGSGTFSKAQSNESAVLVDDFLLTGVNLYQVASISGEAIDYSTSDPMSFVRGLKLKVEKAMDALADQIENYLPRSGSGSLGQIGSLSTTSLTLKDTADVQPFEIGQKLVHGDGTDGGDLGSSAAALAVSGVNRTTGVLSAATDWDATWNDPAVGDDHIYIEGTAQDGTSNALPAIAGFDRWISSSGQSSLFGVNTQVDSRLHGHVYDGSSLSIEEGLIDGASIGAGEGADINLCFVHPVSYRNMVKTVSTRVQYDKLSAMGAKGEVAHIAFKSLVLDGPTSPIPVVAANKCQRQRGWLLDRETWTLNSNGSATKIIDKDGLRIRAKASSDSFESRFVFRGNLSCNAPGYNVRVTLPST